jgi:hypothetical protein
MTAKSQAVRAAQEVTARTRRVWTGASLADLCEVPGVVAAVPHPEGGCLVTLDAGYEAEAVLAALARLDDGDAED